MNSLYGWVLGHGHMGSHHLKKLLQLPGVHAEAYDPPKGLTPSRNDPQFAVVATPAQTHRTVAEPLLKRGIPVLIEKPIATNRQDAEILARYPNCFVGHIERFNPAWRAIQSCQNPKFIHAERMGAFTHRSVDIGVALDLMIHDIDLCLSMDDSPIQDIRSISMGLHTTQDLLNARIETEKCVFQLTASRIAQKGQRQLRVFTDTAYWSLDLQNQKAKTVSWHEGSISESHLTIPKTDALAQQIRCFVAHVRGETTFPITGAEGLRALDVALRVTEACR